MKAQVNVLVTQTPVLRCDGPPGVDMGLAMTTVFASAFTHLAQSV